MPFKPASRRSGVPSQGCRSTAMDCETVDMILIIGGMGFIGLNTAQRLVEIGEKVVISQHRAHRVPDILRDELDRQVFTARLDVANAYDVFDVVRRHHVDSIINLMAPPARGVSTQADYQLYTAGLVKLRVISTHFPEPLRPSR
jgi:nucleoside-diphosphate-sugar epimerase